MNRLPTIALALLVLAGCSRPTPEERSVQQNAAAYEASLRNQADNLAAMADAAADENAAEAMRNAADGLEDARRDVDDAADARLDNLR